MYHSYFGLDEQAFSIAVNPRYLYMSTQHREALALYAKLPKSSRYYAELQNHHYPLPAGAIARSRRSGDRHEPLCQRARLAVQYLR